MELRAIMELGGGRGKSTRRKKKPYIVGGTIQPLSPTQPRTEWYYRLRERYYRLCTGCGCIRVGFYPHYIRESSSPN